MALSFAAGASCPVSAEQHYETHGIIQGIILKTGQVDSSANSISVNTRSYLLTDKIIRRFEYLFDEEPVEDGIIHKAEELFADILSSEAELSLLSLIHSKLEYPEGSSFLESMLAIFGRLAEPGTNEWRAVIIEDALRSKDIRVRDKAIQSIENWGDSNLATILHQYCKTEEEPWLKEYAIEVAEELLG